MTQNQAITPATQGAQEKTSEKSDDQKKSASAIKEMLQNLETKSAQARRTIASSKAKHQKAADSQKANYSAGTAETGQGQGLQIAGIATKGVGTATQATALALKSNPWTIGAGIAMFAAGAAQVGIGVAQMNKGSAMEQAGMEKLDKAVEDGVVAKEQMKVASKAMKQSNVMRIKENVLKNNLEKMRADNPGKSDEEIKGDFNKKFDKAAETLKNGGIMEMEGKDGKSQFFMQKEDGSIVEVDVKKGEDGKPAKNAHGGLQLDTEKDPKDVSQDNPLYKEIKDNFNLVDQIKTEMKKEGTFDPNNPIEMAEFGELNKLNDKNPPLKYGEAVNPETGEVDQYFVKYDWQNDKEVGEKVWMKELTGGDYDPSNPDSVEAAKAKSAAAFEKLGLDPTSDTYKDLKAISDKFGQSSVGSNNALDLYKSDALKDLEEMKKNSGLSGYLDYNSDQSDTEKNKSGNSVAQS